MERDWVKIYTTSDLIKAEMIRQILSCNQINAVIMNKQSAPYRFGEVVVYIHQNNFQEAVEIIITSDL